MIHTIFLPYGAKVPTRSVGDVVVGGSYSLGFFASLSNNIATHVLIDGYRLHLDLGTDSVFVQGVGNLSSSVAPQLNIEGVVFGPNFSIAVGDLQSQTGFIYATGYNQIAGTLDGNDSLSIHILDQTDMTGAISVPGTLNNTGVLIAPSFIDGDADSKLINTGTINIPASGSLGLGTFIGVNIMGSGTIDLSGDLTLTNKIATGQTIDFTAGSLSLFDLKEFYATIADFNTHDTIYLNNLATTAVYNNGLVTLYDAGQNNVGKLHFKRPTGAIFTSDSFHVDNGVLTTTNTVFHAG